MPLLLALFIFFHSLLVFALALLAAILVHLIVRRRSLFSRSFLWTLGSAYFLFVLMYSVSPRLRYLEFKVTHPAWLEVPAAVEKVETIWKPRMRRQMPHAVANVRYYYTDASTGETMRGTRGEAIEKYSYRFWNTAASGARCQERLRAAAEAYVAAQNSRPGTSESRLFMPLNTVLLSGSAVLNILFGFFKSVLVIALVVLVFMGLGKLFEKR